jgi:uncharacterized membrane protein YccC
MARFISGKRVRRPRHIVRQFYNSALAIVAGLTVATLSFRLMPPLSPAFRSRRLLALTLRDLRRLATGLIPRTSADWEGHMYGRLSAMPDRAEPLQRAQLLAALSVGTKIIQLRRITQRLNLQSELDAALESIVWGDSAAAVSRLAALDKTLATRPGAAALRGPAAGFLRFRRRLANMQSISMREGSGEVRRNQPFPRLCRAG